MKLPLRSVERVLSNTLYAKSEPELRFLRKGDMLMKKLMTYERPLLRPVRHLTRRNKYSPQEAAVRVEDVRRGGRQSTDWEPSRQGEWVILMCQCLAQMNLMIHTIHQSVMKRVTFLLCKSVDESSSEEEKRGSSGSAKTLGDLQRVCVETLVFWWFWLRGAIERYRSSECLQTFPE
ncbi:hypothetical protein J437_LFUL011706 [Ladona fulva]|uniref:Uncharacterized protein n=1 Tax=Ladona fulva TaxID=123851 RepID=A0A8K0KVV3_LADFU|nr:hypothetical protein J437_LFUL011706 [Ladona fulva]